MQALNKHRLDLQAINEGKWIAIRGDRFLVARISCAGMARQRALVMAEIGLAPDADVPPQHVERVDAWLFSRAILRDFKIEGSDDPYTPAAGELIWSDPELRGLRNEIMQAADGDYTKDEVAKAAILGN